MVDILQWIVGIAVVLVIWEGLYRLDNWNRKFVDKLKAKMTAKSEASINRTKLSTSIITKNPEIPEYLASQNGWKYSAIKPMEILQEAKKRGLISSLNQPYNTY